MMSSDAYSSNWFSITGKYPSQWASLITERQTKTTKETVKIKSLFFCRNYIPLQNYYVWRKTDNMHTDTSSEGKESEFTVRTCSKELPMVNNVLRLQEKKQRAFYLRCILFPDLSLDVILCLPCCTFAFNSWHN